MRLKALSFLILCGIELLSHYSWQQRTLINITQGHSFGRILAADHPLSSILGMVLASRFVDFEDIV